MSVEDIPKDFDEWVFAEHFTYSSSGDFGHIFYSHRDFPKDFWVNVWLTSDGKLNCKVLIRGVVCAYEGVEGRSPAQCIRHLLEEVMVPYRDKVKAYLEHTTAHNANPGLKISCDLCGFENLDYAAFQHFCQEHYSGAFTKRAQ